MPYYALDFSSCDRARCFTHTVRRYNYELFDLDCGTFGLSPPGATVSCVFTGLSARRPVIVHAKLDVI